MTSVDLHLQIEHTEPSCVIDQKQLHHTALTTLGFFEPDDYALSIVIVDNAQSQLLNHTYRQKDKPTNVLSFVSDLPDNIVQALDHTPLGDLVICLPVVLQEAQAQQKSVQAHLSHLVVHGILHLLGYDHELGEQEANEMEQLEIEILSKLGIENPYRDDEF